MLGLTGFTALLRVYKAPLHRGRLGQRKFHLVETPFSARVSAVFNGLPIIAVDVEVKLALPGFFHPESQHPGLRQGGAQQTAGISAG